MALGSVLQALIVLAIVLIGSNFAGQLFRRIGQPAVVGIIFFGLFVGTLLSLSPQSVKSILVPPSSISFIDSAGEAGLLLTLFLVGTELRIYGKSDERSPRRIFVVCVAIIFAACAIVVWPFTSRLLGPDHNAVHTWLFIAAALSGSALPVLALVIRDLGVPAPVPGIALRIGVTADATAWALVTLLVVLTTDLRSVSVTAVCVGAALLLLEMFVLPRFVQRCFRNSVQGAPFILAVLGYILVGGSATQILGVHPALGAVTAGLFFPMSLANEASQRALAAVADVLIPAFFVSSALSLPLQTLVDLCQWKVLVCLLTLGTVVFGAKVVAGLVAGRIQRWPLPTAARLGILLNCRGVTDLAIASVGLHARLIGPNAFAMLCALAILTTAVTAPIYRAVDRRTTARAFRAPTQEVAPV